jgi:hypothetical protein
MTLRDFMRAPGYGPRISSASLRVAQSAIPNVLRSIRGTRHYCVAAPNVSQAFSVPC